MAEITDRMKIMYPSLDDESWFPLIETMMDSIDVELSEMSKQQNVLYFGGGDVSWTLSTQLLEWTEDIVFVLPNSGVRQRVEGPSSLVIEAGEFVVVDLVFEPVTSSPASMFSAPSLVVSGQHKTIAFRDGDTIKFTTGLRLWDGDTNAGVRL